MRSYYDSWIELSESQKREWLDESKGGYLNYYCKHKKQSKRRILNNIVWELQKHPGELFEMYQMILDMGYKNENLYPAYEFILLWLINEMKCGEPYDRYCIFFSLEDYYSRIGNYVRAIEIDKMAYDELDSYIEGFHFYAVTEYEKNYLPSFVFCRDRLQYDLFDNNQYDESRLYEDDSIAKGYYDGELGERRLLFNRQLRLQREIPYLIRNGELEKAILRCDELKQYNEENSGSYYKKVAFAYYRKKEYLISKHYYEQALQLIPNDTGVSKKIQIIEKKTYLEY